MKNITKTGPLALACLGAVSAAGGQQVAPPSIEKPNVIVIFTDDHGYADLLCQGQLNDLKTPNIDRLAADGVRCTSGYVSAPQCIPSRAGILSGRYQQRFGVIHNGAIPMPLDETLIPQRLQKAGYATGMVGKWHLDPNPAEKQWIQENMPANTIRTGTRVRIPHHMIRPYLPDVRGFTDCFCGHINTYWATYDLDGKDISPARNIREKGFRVDIQTNAALTFIDRHKEDPFFLYLAYFAPHVPLEATAKYLKRFPGEMPERRRTALAMLAAIDDGVGRIREKLADNGLAKNTLIFFISDNGAPLKIDMKDLPLSFKGGAWDGSRNDPWVGEKGMLAEGGIRVPFVVTWPGKIPAGKTYDQPVISLDVGATAVELAGLKKPKTLDGVNLIPHLTGKILKPPHDKLFWRFWNQSAIREGQWKYLQADGHLKYLFNLESPEQEKKNLIREHPDVAKKLATDLQTWAKQLKTPGVPSRALNGQEVKWYDHYLPK